MALAALAVLVVGAAAEVLAVLVHLDKAIMAATLLLQETLLRVVAAGGRLLGVLGGCGAGLEAGALRRIADTLV
jgi:hypothetical protein